MISNYFGSFGAPDLGQGFWVSMAAAVENGILSKGRRNSGCWKSKVCDFGKPVAAVQCLLCRLTLSRPTS